MVVVDSLFTPLNAALEQTPQMEAKLPINAALDETPHPMRTMWRLFEDYKKKIRYNSVIYTILGNLFS